MNGTPLTDRNVDYPNRYRLVKVGGTEDIYELIPAPGGVKAEGTLINKGVLYSDRVKSMYPNGVNNPDDAFEELMRNKISMHPDAGSNPAIGMLGASLDGTDVASIVGANDCGYVEAYTKNGYGTRSQLVIPSYPNVGNIRISQTPDSTNWTDYRLYHEGFKPTPQGIGVSPTICGAVTVSRGNTNTTIVTPFVPDFFCIGGDMDDTYDRDYAEIVIIGVRGQNTTPVLGRNMNVSDIGDIVRFDTTELTWNNNSVVIAHNRGHSYGRSYWYFAAGHYA